MHISYRFITPPPPPRRTSSSIMKHGQESQPQIRFNERLVLPVAVMTSHADDPAPPPPSFPPSFLPSLPPSNNSWPPMAAFINSLFDSFVYKLALFPNYSQRCCVRFQRKKWRRRWRRQRPGLQSRCQQIQNISKTTIYPHLRATRHQQIQLKYLKKKYP